MTSLQLSTLLNIGSLALGVLAWLLAIFAISSSKASCVHRNTVLSYSCCAVSLMLQLFEVNNRANIGDYAAITDTARAVLMAAVALVSVTIILNAAAWLKAKNR